MQKFFWIVAASLALVRCGHPADEKPTPRTPLSGDAAGQAKNATELKIYLPDRAALAAEVPNVKTEMNAYNLKLWNADAACATPADLQEVGKIIEGELISVSVGQGCDYKLELELGQKNLALLLNNASAINYEDDIKPLISKACISCHAPGKSRSQSDLTTWDGVNTYKSVSVAMVEDGSMPPGGSLSADEIAIFTNWKAQGYLQTAPADGGTDNGGGGGGSPSPGGTNGGAGDGGGSTSGETEKLASVYYRNNRSMVIGKEQIVGKSSAILRFELNLQEAGQEKGFVTQVLNTEVGPATEANGEGDGQRLVSYESDIKSILDSACVSCHQELNSYQGAAKAATVERILDGTMPPAGGLSTIQKELFKDWQAASFPEQSN